MANCIYCGFPAPVGKDSHPDCKNSPSQPPQTRIENGAKSITAPEWLSDEKRIFLQQIAPVIQKAVFRGVLFAGLVLFGIGVLLGVLYAACTAH